MKQEKTFSSFTLDNDIKYHSQETILHYNNEYKVSPGRPHIQMIEMAVFGHKTDQNLGKLVTIMRNNKYYVVYEEYFNNLQEVLVQHKLDKKDYLHINLDRENAPASIETQYFYNKYCTDKIILERYFKNNKMHRLDGPAIITKSSAATEYMWFVNGKEIDLNLCVVMNDKLYSLIDIDNLFYKFVNKHMNLYSITKPIINIYNCKFPRIILFPFKKKKLTRKYILDIALNFDREYAGFLHDYAKKHNLY